MWISGPTEGLENIFLLLQSMSNPDKRVYVCFIPKQAMIAMLCKRSANVVPSDLFLSITSRNKFRKISLCQITERHPCRDC